MDKEQEIEKMVQIAYEYSKDIANTPYYKGARTDMEAIYDAGYRKDSEVRKEVIKEMMNYVLGKRHNSPLPDLELMKCFARKNGVEVGEK